MTKKKMTPARRRQVGWTVFCVLASGLFLYAASLLGGLSARATLVVLVGPPAIVQLWLGVPWLELRQMTRDSDTRTRWRPQAERQVVVVRPARGEVLEGEVIR
jgi:hypothetical protein